MKVFLETYGCQMNQLDSELVVGQLRTHGYAFTRDRASADVVLYNTCSVRQHAEDRVLSNIGALKHAKAHRGDLIIGLVGCMAERDKENLFRKLPHLDLLCGPGELDKLPALLQQVRDQRLRVSAFTGIAARRLKTLDEAQTRAIEAIDLARTVSPSDDVTQSYVRIMRGCDKFCTYCIVPKVRGPERCRPPEHILNEVKMLEASGCKEVTLLGQTVNSYSYDEGCRIGFAALLDMLHEQTSLPRIRFVTSYPKDFDDDALRVVGQSDRICAYLHAPAQHGNDRVLEAMNRGYLSSDYYRFVDRVQKYAPKAVIASDFIVGFPTETDAEFRDSLAMIRRVKFKSSYVFKYSPRPATAAYHRDDDVDDACKRSRNAEMLAVQQEVSLDHYRQFIGQTVTVLVEGPSKNQRKASTDNVELGGAFPIQLSGRTAGDHIVVFNGPRTLAGEIIDVEVDDCTFTTLIGRRRSSEGREEEFRV